MVRTDLDPVAFRIADDLRSTIAAIVKGDNFYFTPAAVEISEPFRWDPNEFPTIFIAPRNNAVDDEGKALTDAIVQRRAFEIVGVLEGRDDTLLEAERLLADIEHAITVDVGRNNLARYTRVNSWEPVLLIGDEDSRHGIVMQAEVQFTTEQDDLTTPV